VVTDGAPSMAESERPIVAVRGSAPGYFRTARIPMISGRDFTDGDTHDRPPVAIISELAAAKFWPGENPLGKRITLTLMENQPREIVGVVREVKTQQIDERIAETAIYLPLYQSLYDGTTLLARTSVPAETLSRPLVAAVQAIDAEQPVLNIRTMDQIVEESLGDRRVAMQLLGGFAALAVVLAAVGIYSVLAYTVRQRVREIGIRIALGASPGNVLRLIALDGLKPTVVGVVLGLGLAAVFTRVLSALLYGVSEHDRLTFISVAIVGLTMGILATVLPTYRASRVDPVVALRGEQ